MKKFLLLILALAILFGLYYVISPLFDVKEVDDALPNTQTRGEVVKSGFEELSEEEKVEMSRQVSEANEVEKKPMDDDMGVSIETAVLYSDVQSTAGHPASGIVGVFDTNEGKIVRFENFETINGPKLHVYLSKDLEGNEFIDLGPIRGTSGNINYQVPEGVDLSEYKYVMHWCVPFGVLFNYAELI